MATVRKARDSQRLTAGVANARRGAIGVLVWAAALMAVTCVPYLVAIGMAPENTRFMGFLWGVDEGNVYLQWMRQASEGRLVLANQYTTLDQNPRFVNLFFITGGLLSRVTGLSLIVVYHAVRVLGGIALIWCFYLLVCEITHRSWVRYGAVAFASVSSGLGWIWVLAAQAGHTGLRPVDVAANWQAQPEAITFVSLFLNPLFVVSMALLCLVMLHGMRAATRGWRNAVICGLLLLVLGNIHSYDVFICYATLGAWFMLHALSGALRARAAIGRFAVIVALSLPAPLWAWYMLQTDPAFKAKIGTPTLSARPVEYLVSFGIPLLLAIPGAAYAVGQWLGRWRAERASGRPRALAPSPLALPVIWVVLNFALLYMPTEFQRKVIEGIHLPISILAAAGAVCAIAAPLARQVSTATLLGGLLALSVPSNLVFISGCLQHASVNNRDLLAVLQPPMYLTHDEIEAMEYLRASATFEDVVMCSSLTGSFIPTRAPCRVYAGHWCETIEFPRALQGVTHFFTPGQTPEQRRLVLSTTGSTLVLYGPQERLLQTGLAGRLAGPGSGALVNEDVSAGLPELVPVFHNETVTVFRFQPERAEPAPAGGARSPHET